jgi:uncharacterized protein (TIGR04141 family)
MEIRGKEKMKADKNKLTIYLIKDLLQVAPVKDTAEKIDVKGIPDNVSIYLDEANINKPKYLTSFFDGKLDKKNLYSASSKVILTVKINDKTFAVAFGNGRFLLKDDVIERRFGLRTALNMLDENSIKAFQKTSLESNPKNSNEQLSKVADKSVFGINIEQDLIKGISGKTKSEYHEFSANIAGSDSLTLTVKCNIKNIVEILEKVLETYNKEDYKVNFDWIDQIQSIKDKSKREELENELIEALKSSQDDITVWASAPEYLDWEKHGGFRIGGKKSNIIEDFDKQQILDSLKGGEITTENLKGLKIVAISSENHTEEIANWTAYKCIYAEIKKKNEVYLLYDGEWFEIARDFSESVNNDFVEIKDKGSSVIFCEYDATCKRESDYNKKLAQSINGKCFDAKLIQHGGGQSKFEVCDVYTNNGDFIHVKHYSGSSTLSHLFNQGYVSGEMLKGDEKFQAEVSKKLLDSKGIGDLNGKKIIFAIISDKPDEKFNIPFFSKITLRNVRRQLKNMGYVVELAKIRNTQVGMISES